jgi:hypothetical protein
LRAAAAEYGHMRFLLVLILPALFAGQAATASNTVPSGPAGSGAGVVSGYTISSVSYSLAGDTVDGVSFALSPTGAAMVKVRLAASEPWTGCTIAGGIADCALSIRVAEAESLEIAASA